MGKCPSLVVRTFEDFCYPQCYPDEICCQAYIIFDFMARTKRFRTPAPEIESLVCYVDSPTTRLSGVVIAVITRRSGGGVSTVQQYLKPGLIDELQLAIAPVALGRGEVMVAGIDLPALGFRVTEHARDAYRA
jgi:hypothetical protein